MEFSTDKWIEVLGFLIVNESPSVTAISKKIDVTYSHVLKIINHMMEVRLVRTEKVGRIKAVQLTSKGKEIAKPCSQIVEFVKNEMQA